MGGGSIWDVGCYPISYSRVIAGAAPVEVFGWQVNSPSGVDEVFTGQIRFPGDIFAQFDCGFQSPFRSYMELIGTKGSMRIPLPFQADQDSVIQVMQGDKSDIVPTPGADRYLLEVEDMADAILQGKAPRVSLADSRQNVAAILALLQSAREGRPISLK